MHHDEYGLPCGAVITRLRLLVSDKRVDNIMASAPEAFEGTTFIELHVRKMRQEVTDLKYEVNI